MRKFNKNVVKKIAAGALSTAMLMGALTGCGVSTSSTEDTADNADTQVAETTTSDASNGTDSDAELSSEVKETEKVAASADGRTEVEFWYAGGKTAVGIVEEIVEDFNNSQDEYFVKTSTMADYDETYQKLQAGKIEHLSQKSQRRIIPARKEPAVQEGNSLSAAVTDIKAQGVILQHRQPGFRQGSLRIGRHIPFQPGSVRIIVP